MSRCVYCGYSGVKIHSGRSNPRLTLRGLFSPGRVVERFASTKHYDCRACEKKYEVLGKIKLNWIRTSMLVTQSALNNLRDSLPGIAFEKIFEKKSVVAITKLSEQTYHLLFKVSGKRAYLELQRTNGIFTVVSVWRLF